MSSNFPPPFGEITNKVTLVSRQSMLETVEWLSGPCGHRHAITVFPFINQIWISDSAIDCLFIMQKNFEAGEEVAEATNGETEEEREIAEYKGLPKYVTTLDSADEDWELNGQSGL